MNTSFMGLSFRLIYFDTKTYSSFMGRVLVNKTFNWHLKSRPKFSFSPPETIMVHADILYVIALQSKCLVSVVDKNTGKILINIVFVLFNNIFSSFKSCYKHVQQKIFWLLVFDLQDFEEFYYTSLVYIKCAKGY